MLNTATKIRIARLLYTAVHLLRRPLGGTDTVTVERGGIRWQLDLREGIDLTIFLAGAFERTTLEALRAWVRPGMTVLDIGANVGAHALQLARLVGDSGQVLAFEPTVFALEKLRANLAANPALSARVKVHHAFLVSHDGDAVAPTVASSWPVDGTRPDDADMGSRSMDVAGAVPMTVDGAVRAAGSPDVRVIKMDVDGHELQVLEGARGVLARCHPVIVMELAPYVFSPPEGFDRMVELLTSHGYRFRALNSRVELPPSPQALRAHIPRHGSLNVVALHRDGPGAPRR